MENIKVNCKMETNEKKPLNRYHKGINDIHFQIYLKCIDVLSRAFTGFLNYLDF